MKSLNFPAEKLLAAFKRYKYLLLVIAAGFVILLWPTGSPGGDIVSDGDYPTFSLSEMERKLEEALGNVEGIGRVHVVLTLRSDMSLILQEDVSTQTSRKYENGATSSFDASSQRKTVMASSGSEQRPVVTMRKYPEFGGALIVCDGGDKPVIRLAAADAVSALTGLGSDKITILKMKN